MQTPYQRHLADEIANTLGIGTADVKLLSLDAALWLAECDIPEYETHGVNPFDACTLSVDPYDPRNKAPAAATVVGKRISR